MAFNAGFTRYQKKKWLDAMAALATLKLAIYSTVTGLDATQDPASPLVYTVTGELTSSGTGYTAGGFALSGASVTWDSGNSRYQLTFTDPAATTGTIAVGTYGAMLYDTADANKVIAVFTVNVTTGSSAGTMSFDIPANGLAIG